MGIPTSMTIGQYRRSLPEYLRLSLLLNADSAYNLLALAEWLMERLESLPDNVDLTETMVSLLMAAWENCPFDVKAASAVAQLHQQRPFLSPQAAAFAARCTAAQPRLPKDIEQFLSLYGGYDLEGLKRFLDGRRQGEEALFWLRFAHHIAMLNNETEWFAPWISAVDLPQAMRKALAGDICFVQKDWIKAALMYATAYKGMPLNGFLLKQGESLLRAGQREEALGLFTRVLAEQPWNSNLLLKTTDLLQGLDQPGPLPAGKGQVLFYTWNHGKDFAKALAALAESDLGPAENCGITVLDNGSTDETPQIVKAWQERLGERLSLVTLPVNVGAPAARNWLLALPQTQTADWVVYLDDDAMVPPDWLRYFGRAMQAYPQASVYGCRIVDHTADMTLQSVDLNFEVPKPESDLAGKGFDLSNIHNLEPDFGQYSYMRPCASVTGCCHLLTRASLDKHGGFDLRFSPSQFDDFERDLRECLGGDLPVYQGHLRVRHMKRSGTMSGMSQWQQANVEGNILKLQKSYSAGQIAAMRTLAYAGIEADMQKRIALLAASV